MFTFRIFYIVELASPPYIVYGLPFVFFILSHLQQFSGWKQNTTIIKIQQNIFF